MLQKAINESPVLSCSQELVSAGFYYIESAKTGSGLTWRERLSQRLYINNKPE